MGTKLGNSLGQLESTDEIMNQRNSLKFGNNNEFMAFVARNVDSSNKQVFYQESYPDARPISDLLAQMYGYNAGSDDNEDMLESLDALKSAEILNNKKISVSTSNQNY